MSPTCHSNNGLLICWHEFLECSQVQKHTAGHVVMQFHIGNLHISSSILDDKQKIKHWYEKTSESVVHIFEVAFAFGKCTCNSTLETCTSHCPVWTTNRKLYIDMKKTSESVVHIFYTLPYMCSILCQNFTLLPIILSEIWIIIYDFWSSPDDRQTDRQTTDDRQKAMHMSPPCNLHRRAQK